MSRDELFTRARQMAAQSATPTTIEAQLAVLARRRKRRARPGLGRVGVFASRDFEAVESPRYWWQRD